MYKLYDKIKPQTGILHYELLSDEKVISMLMKIQNQPFLLNDNVPLISPDDELKELRYAMHYLHPIEIEFDLENVENLCDLQYRCHQDTELKNIYATILLNGKRTNLSIQNLCFGTLNGNALEVEIHFKFNDLLDFEDFGCLELTLQIVGGFPVLQRNGLVMVQK